MGHVRDQELVLPIVVAFSAFPKALEWGTNWARKYFDCECTLSPPFEFTHTDYYRIPMGDGLIKRFVVPHRLVSTDFLSDIKLSSNLAEEELASSRSYPCSRPLNLDPGYLNMSKFVLASTKDHAHRLAIGKGIFAEMTLRYQGGSWQPWPWTYPDYREPLYHGFLDECRAMYRKLRLESDGTRIECPEGRP